MKIKQLLGAAILAGGLSVPSAHGQPPASTPYPPPAPIAVHKSDDAPAEELVPASGGLSDWIVNRRDCCEGHPGKVTPLYTELYITAGPSAPVGRGTSDLAHELQTGWSIAGGARALFFNEPLTRAWVVDLHLINTDQSAGRNNQSFPLKFLHNGVSSELVFFRGKTGTTNFTLQNSNRTMVGLGFGRVWYLWKSAVVEGCHWRAGMDLGGRVGSHRINLNEFGHVTDVVGGGYLAAHTDLEIPCHCIVFFVGARLEWAYTAGDILVRNSDIQDLNFLLTLGIRF